MPSCPPIDHILHDLRWCQANLPIAGNRSCSKHSPQLSTAKRVQHLWQSRTSHRLGHYYEMLWQALLEAENEFQVLACDLQLNHEKKTLGALDFLLLDAATNQYTHLEVAVKFYLLYGNAQDPMAWVGPNAKDRLGRKLNHLRQHQTQLLQSAPGRGAINAFLAQHSHPSLHADNLQVQQMIQGWLFTPWGDMAALPLGDSEHRGWWCRFSDLEQIAQALPAQLIWLPKLYWLSGAHQLHDLPLDPSDPPLASPAFVSAARLRGWLCDHPSPHLFQWPTDEGPKRLFLVPDHWPAQADFRDTPSRKM